MSSREALLDRATELLAASFDGDISTRAVCEAAGVGQPILYRNFGDKDGLIAAVVERIWLAHATALDAIETADPVADLRTLWDAHLAFAQANVNVYTLLFGSRSVAAAVATDAVLERFTSVLERCADHGRLRIAPVDAARSLFAAVTGSALGLLLRGAHYPRRGTTDAVCDAVLAGLLIAEDTDLSAVEPIIAVRARLAVADDFTPAEGQLMREWLTRLQSSDPVA